MRLGFFGILFCSAFGLMAQPDSSTLPIDVDFLFNYYEQEGQHAAVTGGQGSEELADRAGKIVVKVPLDSARKIVASTALNHYTSASTDKIDSYVSSASRRDSRAWVQLGFESVINKQKQWGLGGGLSIESDYISRSLNAYWQWSSADQNRSLNLAAQAFFDTWIVIFPEELRAPGLATVPTDKRRSFNLAFNWSQVINQRIQASLSADFVVQQGLLSTPFHRVYFVGESLPKIEKFPLWRFKYPVGLRLNWFATDWLVVRSYYRNYHDSFGISAHTVQLESPVKLGLSLAILPFYRYHTQSAADFFAPFAQHQIEQAYYTSDFDLSAFQSQKWGLGLRIAPLYGLSRFKVGPRRVAMLRKTTLRYARYVRSDGLNAHIFSLDLSWRL
jgi:hypothetical protein